MVENIFSLWALVAIAIVIVIVLVATLAAYRIGRRDGLQAFPTLGRALTDAQRLLAQAETDRRQAEENARSNIADYKKKVQDEIGLVIELLTNPMSMNWSLHLYESDKKEAFDRILVATDAAGANKVNLQRLIEVKKTEGQSKWDLSIVDRVMAHDEQPFRIHLVLPTTGQRVSVPWKKEQVASQR